MGHRETGASEPPARNKGPDIRQYEELIEEYYSLAQDYAILESDSAESESCEDATQDELVKELAEHRSKLERLCESFDEEDYKVLFERGDK